MLSMALPRAAAAASVAFGLLVVTTDASTAACAEGGGCDLQQEEEASMLQVMAAGPKPDPPTIADIAAVLHTLPGWLPVTTPEDQARLDAIGEDCEVNNCPYSNMDKSKIYHVYTGGETACLDPLRPRYYFEVKPGASDKLYIHLQGGGACWDKLTFQADMCVKKTTPDGWDGLLNYTDPQNPYQDYTMVKVLYCSGDMHAGNTTADWRLDGGTVQIKGAYNTAAALGWALENFPQLTELRLAGASAGSLGIQFWSRRMLDDFSNRGARTLVIPDSFAGILFPPWAVQSSESQLYRTWNMCVDSALTPIEQRECSAGRLLLSEVFRRTMKANRKVAFGMINSKADAVQIEFERAFELTAGNLIGALMTPEQFYHSLNNLLQTYITHPNFYGYLVDGDNHVYTSKQLIFETTPLSPTGAENGQPKLIDWIEALPEKDCNAKGPVVCIGKPVVVRRLQRAPNSTTYCDVKLKR